MSVLYIALPVAILLALAAVSAFVWTVSRGQYDDLETPALRMLDDDDRGRSNRGRRNREQGNRPAVSPENSAREKTDQPDDSGKQ
jgi:cbb3-type cytochrome oxidase maturation protein